MFIENLPINMRPHRGRTFSNYPEGGAQSFNSYVVYLQVLKSRHANTHHDHLCYYWHNNSC